MTRRQLVRIAKVLGAIDLLLLSVFAALVFWPRPAPEYHAPQFLQKPKDRPVLESVDKVWKSRMTGVSEFDFDGVHYVVENLPKEYVDYSAWYVRLP